jgi:hypothetical protein
VSLLVYWELQRLIQVIQDDYYSDFPDGCIEERYALCVLLDLLREHKGAG